MAGSLGDLTLSAHEGAVLTIDLSGDTAFARTATTEVFYGGSTAVPLTQPTGRSGPIGLFADLGDEPLEADDRAFLRVSYGDRGDRPGGPGEGFEVFFNGERFAVEPGLLGTDDGDFGLQSRLIDIPVGLILNGINTVEVDFQGNGGSVAATSLTLTRVVAVPEPATALLLAAGSLLTVRRRASC